MNFYWAKCRELWRNKNSESPDSNKSMPQLSLFNKSFDEVPHYNMNVWMLGAKL